MNRSEALVSRLCTRSFLSLWSYPNPVGKKGKELCDVLVVCDPDIIIFSVKEIRAKNSGEVETDWERWTRRAVEGSAKQIYGAERWLQTATHVIRKDGSRSLPLPDLKVRRLHRIAVALGSEGDIPIASQNFEDGGYVHVLEEGALDILMRELDTITDFTDYLRAKEKLLETTMVMVPGEENLLATYLQAGRRSKHTPDFLALEGDLWDRFVQQEAYKAKQRADVDSLAFDEIIERFCRDALAGEHEAGATLTETERVVRMMARESRFNRRILGKAFKEFYEKSARGEVGARMGVSPSGVIYVFLALPRDVARADRKKVLSLRCFVARGLHPDNSEVIGLATERHEGKPGLSFDACYLYLPTWNEERQKRLESIQKELGYFVKPRQQVRGEHEYPPEQS